MGDSTSSARRSLEIKSEYNLARWAVRSRSLSGISVSSGTRFTRLNHSFMVGLISRSSMSATLANFNLVNAGYSSARSMFSRGDFGKLLKTDHIADKHTLKEVE